MSDLALRILLSAQDTASSVIKSVGGSLQSMGSSASGANPGLLMAASGAALVAGAILSTIQPAADFQQSMLKIQAYAGLSKTQMDSMSQSLLDMSTAVGVGPKELADALYPIISSGYNAADALNILKLSAETAAASGAQTSVVADALTTSLGAMHAPASEAAHYMDMLNKIVSIGKGEVPQYAAVIGKLSLAAAGAGVDFATSGAALADLTTHGFPSVAQASTSLGNLFTQIGVKTDALAKHAKSAGVAFDAQKFSTMSLADKLDYLQKITGGNQSELLKLVGGSTVALKAFNALEGGSKDLRSNLEAMKNSAGATDAAFQTASSGLNASMARAQASVQALQVRIGLALLPVVTQLVNAVGPVVNAFSGFVDWLGKANLLMPVLMGILAGCAALILAVVVPALVSMAVSAIAATWPFYLIAAAIAAVVAAFIYFYNNSKPFKAFIDNAVVAVKNFASVLWGDLQTALGFIGAFLKSTFLPVWQQLQDVWNTQILPSIKQLITTFNQIKPELTFIAQIVGVELVIAFGLLVGVVSGLVKAFATFIGGMAVAFGGAVQIVSGFIQIISGYVAFIVDLFTGHFDKLGGDLKVILGGIESVFSGFGNVIKGLFQAWIGSVLSYVSGFATGITGYFNQILHGADDKTKQASIAAQTNTAQMRDKSIQNAQMMSEQMQMKLIDMRNGIENQLKQTTDAAQRHTLEMKLNTVNNSLEMAQASGRNIVDMRQKSLEQIDLLKQGVDVKMMSASDLAKYHSLQMKDNVIQAAEATDTQTIAKFDHMRQGIIDQLMQTQDAAKKHGLEIQLTTVTHAENTAIGVKKQHEKMRKDTESELDKLRKSAGDKFGSIQKDVEKTVGAVGKWIQDKWHEAVTGVEKWFEHLYEHSRVFQRMVDDISHWTKNIQDFLKNAWKAIVTEAQTQWNDLVRLAKDLWNKIAYPFAHAYDQYIQQPLVNFWKQVANVAHTWQTDANNFGINLITGLANGIVWAGKNILHGALTGIANTVKFLIGWHSPTKEGPGSDSDRWAPNLVKMMSTGLEAGVPQIQNAVNKLAKPIALTLGVSNSGALNSLGGSTTNNSGATVQNFTINITTQGGWSRNQVDDMYKQIKDKLSRDLRGSGKLTTWTSGGSV